VPRPTCALARPSPYALGASAPSSGGRVHRSVSPLPSSAFSPLGFLSSRRWPRSLVRQDQTDVSSLARGVMLCRGSTPLHPMTGWHSLLPSSSSRPPLGLPYGSRSPAGDVRGSHVPSPSHTDGAGALCPPGACGAHDKDGESPCTRYRTLLAQVFQHLWLVFSRSPWSYYTTKRLAHFASIHRIPCGQLARSLGTFVPDFLKTKYSAQ